MHRCGKYYSTRFLGVINRENQFYKTSFQTTSWKYFIRQTQSWSCQDKIIMKWASLCHALVVKSSLRNLLVRVYKLYHGCAIITRILTFCKLFLKIFVARIWFLTKVLFVKLDITLYGKLWLKIALDSSCCG